MVLPFFKASLILTIPYFIADEAFPMAFLTEQVGLSFSSCFFLTDNWLCFFWNQAGGLATTGKMRVLDIQPSGIHERTPIFLGSKEDVEDLLKFYK